MIKKIFLTGLFILPFVFWSKAEPAYEVPRVWFFQRWVEVLAISTFIFGLKHINKRKANLLIQVLVILFFISAVISAIFGSDIAKSIWGNYYREDGLMTLIHLVGLFFFICLFWKISWTKPLFTTISLSSFFISSSSIISAARIYLISDFLIESSGEAIGISFGNPVFLAGYLLVTLPFTLYFSFSIRDKRPLKKFFWFTAIVFNIAALLLTYSTIVYTALPLILITSTSLAKLKVKKINPTLLFFLFIIIIGSYYFYFLNKGLSVDTTTLTANNYVFEGRTRIYIKGFMAFLDRPLLGWGWANFDHAFDSIIWPLSFLHDVYVDRAHSHILELLVTTGVAGTIFYLAIIKKVINYYSKFHTDYYKYFLLVLVIFLFHSQTNIVSINEEIIFWIITGVAASNIRS